MLSSLTIKRWQIAHLEIFLSAFKHEQKLCGFTVASEKGGKIWSRTNVSVTQVGISNRELSLSDVNKQTNAVAQV